MHGPRCARGSASSRSLMKSCCRALVLRGLRWHCGMLDRLEIDDIPLVKPFLSTSICGRIRQNFNTTTVDFFSVGGRSQTSFSSRRLILT